MPSTKKAPAAPASQAVAKKAWYKKFLLPFAMIVAFAAVSTYLVNSSKAATNYYVSMIDPQAVNCVQATADSLPPTVKRYDKNDCVRVVQQAMNNWLAVRSWFSQGSIPYRPVAVTNYFDLATENAVKDFQREHSANGKRLAVTGEVGPSTWTAILNDWACLPPSARK